MSSREEISDIVVGFVKRTLPELKYEEVATSASMKDLGATSIDILEVVSATMKKLDVQVPRNKLNELTCLDDLIDLLTELKNSEDVVQ
ncbi:phosphopantetheine-binding protein [Teredinibacter turnerae]|uniref:phosphopantetheine-binding protein n=1 Tax=Teredinibacter turnerae TaxID=2426 RepID=UPI0004103B3D|nr:phosphopantetheine-binding protein [Teredinibacter turnerae]